MSASTVKKGETVAIVGPQAPANRRSFSSSQGSSMCSKGRSDRRQAIERLYPKICCETKSVLWPKNPSLFYDTIEANISYGKQTTPSQIEHAAKRAFADEFIERLANGYKTMLAEGRAEPLRWPAAKACDRKSPF